MSSTRPLKPSYRKTRRCGSGTNTGLLLKVAKLLIPNL
ncbi:hypothetical protein LINPERPRIM_LOCUS13692 [Linum perenne]